MWAIIYGELITIRCIYYFLCSAIHIFYVGDKLVHLIVIDLQNIQPLTFTIIISRPARRREIIICTMCVCMCVRACVTQFSLKLLQLHIFGKSQVLMNFFALQYFWGLVNFGLLLSE